MQHKATKFESNTFAIVAIYGISIVFIIVKDFSRNFGKYLSVNNVLFYLGVDCACGRSLRLRPFCGVSSGFRFPFFLSLSASSPGSVTTHSPIRLICESGPRSNSISPLSVLVRLPHSRKIWHLFRMVPSGQVIVYETLDILGHFFDCTYWGHPKLWISVIFQ